jgi:hypothetical protein
LPRQRLRSQEGKSQVNNTKPGGKQLRPTNQACAREEEEKEDEEKKENTMTRLLNRLEHGRVHFNGNLSRGLVLLKGKKR